MNKPCLVVDASRPGDFEAAVAFIRAAPGSILNVAGPRESRARGIFAFAREFLETVFRELDAEDGELAITVPRKPPGEGGAEA